MKTFQLPASRCPLCESPMEGKIHLFTDPYTWKQAQVWCKNEKCNYFLISDHETKVTDSVIIDWWKNPESPKP